MAYSKDVRIKIILECIDCIRNNVNKESRGLSRYITQKHLNNTPNRSGLRKFCPRCNLHTIHGLFRFYIKKSRN